MNGNRSTQNRLGERSSLDALSRTIEGLEARIEGLVGQASTRDYRARPQDPRDARPDPLSEIRERQRMLEESRNRALSSAARPPIPQPESRSNSLRREVERRLADGYATPRRETASAMPYRETPPSPAPAYRPAAVSTNDHSLKDIAQALVSLREELKRDINDGVTREMTALRNEMRDIRSSASQYGAGDDLRAELSRLGESIDLLGHQNRNRGGSADLRAEFEDLRAMIDGLAREETMRQMDTRWGGLERRISEFDPSPMRDEIVSLAYRLDDIKAQLGTLNPNPAIHALEGRLLAVAEAMEQFGRHMPPSDQMIAEQFAGLDLRLDEISRAIAAGSRALQAQEPEHIARLDHRLAALADQIHQISEQANRRPDPAMELARRMEMLAARVEQIASASSGVEAAARLEERLDQLSYMLERSQQAAPAPELTGFLSDISRKIDALDNSPVNDQLSQRLEYLARRIDEFEYPQLSTGNAGDGALLRLETRLSDIARRLDETVAAPAPDNRALKGLEDQIAHLAELISRPAAVAGAGAGSPEMENRLASIEDYMATSDEYIIEAARQAAEAVMEAYNRNGGAPANVDMSALSALAGDLRHLEEIAHNSEERNSRTFEALHDTLLQIAGRLDEMDMRMRGEPSAADREAPVRPAPVMPRADFNPAPLANDAYFQQDAAPVREAVQAPRGPLVYDEDHFSFDNAGQAYADPRKNMSGPVIRTVEPDLADAVEEAAREMTAMPSAHAQPKVTGSFLANLTSRFLRKGKAAKGQEPTGDRELVDPAPPMVPDDEMLHGSDTELLEPGSGKPDIKSILDRVRSSQMKQTSAPEAGRSDLIAAARRAAQAAAQEAGQAGAARGKTKKASTPGKTAAVKTGEGSLLSRNRRPILMAVGAVLLAIMTLPMVKTFVNGSPAPVAVEANVAGAPAGAPQPVIKVDPAKLEGEAKPAKAKPALAAPAAVAPAPAATAPATGDEGAALVAPKADPARLVAAAPLSGDAAATPLAAPAGAQTPSATIAVPTGLEPKALADAATTGDPLALFEIGARYTDGRGVAADLKAAADWYAKAADKGFAPAQYRLANLYEKGNGVARDVQKAIGLYEKAAASGNASAMHNLAVLYATGIDGKPDNAKAVEWFAKAADLGVADSQFNLAILYARGNGIPQNLEESYKWFAIAAKGGDKDAAQKRDDVANAMNPDQLKSARAKVDLWKAKVIDPRANATDVPDAWTGKGLKTATVDMKKAIRNIQAILNNNGFDAGKPDGEMGAKTVSAIKAFQTKAGMTPDGRITDQLVKELLARNK